MLGASCAPLPNAGRALAGTRRRPQCPPVPAAEITTMLLALGVLLTAARVLGEVARKLGQPAVLGEIVAGIILGPTILGHVAPHGADVCFPWLAPVQHPTATIALSGFTTIAVVLFLLVAGLEVHLSTVARQGRVALSVSLAGIIVPFALGVAAAWWLPEFLGRPEQAGRGAFTLFVATAMAISALPVIAKTLMDLDLYRTDVGMVVMGAAIVQDVVGWLFFAVVLGLMGRGDGAGDPLRTIGLVLGFAVLMITVGRWLINRILPWLHAHASWPGGVISFVLALTFFGAAYSEWSGIHAIFGAFFVGIALGDSPHLQERTRRVVEQFVSHAFAPIFFASIGLKVDFLAYLDWRLDLFVIVLACAGKILGCGLGARSAGMPPREAWTVGFAMNARGAMEIILGALALEYQVIDRRMFVALVVMALATSLMSGPAMQRILARPKPRRVADHLSAKTFAARLAASDSAGAVAELSRLIAPGAGIDAATIAAAVNEREEMMSTCIGESLAVPHARLDGLKGPAVAVGLSGEGVRFGDDAHARIVFLVLTPRDDDGAQLELLADIARTLRHEETRDRAMRAAGFTEFIGTLRTAH
jgi:Kef-type K+ transport system membrane component KefB/mannitol/fructose-specific phosphotransferase system IIA component (Ntr-type)